MAINFKVHEINQDKYMLVLTSEPIKKNYDKDKGVNLPAMNGLKLNKVRKPRNLSILSIFLANFEVTTPALRAL